MHSLSRTHRVRHESINKKTYFLCSPQRRMNNNVEVINAAYDKWILKDPWGLASAGEVTRRLGGGRGSVCAPSALSAAVNQPSGSHP